MGDTEGCLSCPGVQVKVSRSISVNLEWQCEHGKDQHKTFYHLPSRVVQHEMDHLNGKLIIDEKNKWTLHGYYFNGKNLYVLWIDDQGNIKQIKDK